MDGMWPFNLVYANYNSYTVIMTNINWYLICIRQWAKCFTYIFLFQSQNNSIIIYFLHTRKLRCRQVELNLITSDPLLILGKFPNGWIKKYILLLEDLFEIISRLFKKYFSFSNMFNTDICSSMESTRFQLKIK